MRVLVMMGTRPECVKLAPVVNALAQRPAAFEVSVCLTSQHREMLRQALEWFPLPVCADLDVMQSGQRLVELQARILERAQPLVDRIAPDQIMVQGDTATALAGALVGFMNRIPVAHVEAGLRTYDRNAPWPEETNRVLISQLADWHFAPTEANARALRDERVHGRIEVVGNTVIDALLDMRDRLRRDVGLQDSIRASLAASGFDADGDPYLLVTGHRRESFGAGMQSICQALLEIAVQHPHLRVVYAVHLNPNVHDIVHQRLAGADNIHLLPPQDYAAFVYLMDHCRLILTDSGGIQEEAPSLAKPVLVMRDTTERAEAVEAGAVRLVGTDVQRILQSVNELLDDAQAYRRMAEAANPFGDGRAAQRIADLLQAPAGGGRNIA